MGKVFSPFFRSAAVLAALAIMPVHAVAQPAASPPDNHAIESYRKARQILDAGIAATGGLEALEQLRTVTRVLEVKRMDPGQARARWNGEYDAEKLPAYSGGIMSGTLDYTSHRLWVRHHDEASPGEANVFYEVASPDQNYTLRWMRAEPPFYALLPAGSERARHQREIRLYPEALLKAALARPATLGWSGKAIVDGADADVISFVDVTGTRVYLYFDARSRLMVRSETVSDHSVLGDSTLSATFSDYRREGPIMVPQRIISRRNDRAARDYRLRSIAFNTAFEAADMTPPADHIVQPADPAEPVLKAEGRGIYEIRGEYNVMFALFSDYVLLVEAPRDESYAKQVFDLIRSVEPVKPIRVVATHFHFDHIGGMRYAASVADEIWATADAKAEIERALGYQPTIRRDALARNPKSTPVRLIGKGHVFEDAGQRVEVANVGPVDHAAEILVAYFPTVSTMLVADLWDVFAPDRPLTGIDAEQFLPKVRALGWKPEKMLSVHGASASMAALEQSLAARSTYLAGFAASEPKGGAQ